ncbi:hypothetical protein [Streptomyces sp. Ru87]|uniref:hypothetical protein n=1 Tax=Streptomyces sp. Ru87 TaxID=2044307 RepID=UPI000BF5505C|nr:hypothetical protein [Streptomyces sp. Ru87]PGH46773.1 hypothetical protein CRI70_32180 [Streptomyces sp. Ru87]
MTDHTDPRPRENTRASRPAPEDFRASRPAPEDTRASRPDAERRAAEHRHGEPAVTAERTAAGEIGVTAPGYRLTVAADGTTARLLAGGAYPVEFQLPGALDRTGAVDETLSVAAPVLDTSGPAPVVTVTRRSTAWDHAETRLVCTPEGPEFSWSVRGAGRLESVALFATRSARGGRGSGLCPSGHDWQTLFTPSPGPPRRLLRGAGESAVIGACGDARPGRGHWFFTPAPLCLALTGARLPDDTDPAAPGAGEWCTLGLGAPVRELTFTQLRYVPSDQGWHLSCDYEGHTRVDGAFRTPALLVSPGHPDPYAGLRAHRRWLEAHGWAPAPDPGERPAWWSEPMFCGWGAQTARARDTGRPAPALATQREYDAHLAVLEAHGLVPGTVVVDDKWQRVYGSWEPDPVKWPDLRAWIAYRHARGQKVLLWWRAWATEGVPEEFCVRTPDGVPVALDPGHPGARVLLAGNIDRLLAPDGLDADGLKIDFTADTPSGHSLTTAGDRWGLALLYDQLATIHDAAKGAKPDALVVTHTPHPAFAAVTDMIRLNDMLRLDDPDPRARVVPQMRYRAAVARAACPGLLTDTDDWCAPDLAQWRAYGAAKRELGVPALYVTTHLDRTGEELQECDYAALREQWERWRDRGRR